MRKKAGWFVLILLGGAFASFFLAFSLGGWLGTSLAQVGVSVGVLPNQYNTLNAQLDQKAAYLKEQQAYLDQQAAALASSTAAAEAGQTPLGLGMSAILWYLAIVVTLMIVLFAANLFIERKREREVRETLAEDREALAEERAIRDEEGSSHGKMGG